MLTRPYDFTRQVPRPIDSRKRPILYINSLCLSVTELRSVTDRRPGPARHSRIGGWVQSNDPDSQRVKPARPRLTTHGQVRVKLARPRLTTHGRARRRTVPFLSYLTQPHDLSNSTTQILEESNVHGRERQCADGREDGQIPFSFTVHTLSIFSIQRPRFPKTLTCTTKIFSCAPFAKRKSSAAY
jgi:hypothetical protein